MLFYLLLTTFLIGLSYLFVMGWRSHHTVPEAWLKKRLQTISAAAETDSDFGQLRIGDEIWSYSSPPETWEKLCGRSGFALVRNGKVIRKKLGMMN